jgi:antitoxin VapB
MAHLAKLFINGRSQAVRLPAEYRFKSKEVYIRRNEDTGDIIISEKPDSWDAFFDMLGGLHVPDDFLSDVRQMEEARDPFEGWVE